MLVCLSILKCFTTASVGIVIWVIKARMYSSRNMSVCALKTVSTFAGEDHCHEVITKQSQNSDFSFV